MKPNLLELYVYKLNEVQSRIILFYIILTELSAVQDENVEKLHNN